MADIGKGRPRGLLRRVVAYPGDYPGDDLDLAYAALSALGAGAAYGYTLMGVSAGLVDPLFESVEVSGWGTGVGVSGSILVGVCLYEADGSTEAAFEGSLASALDAYPESFGAAVEIHFRGPSERLTLHLKSGDPSPFAEEQRRGISDTRYHEILKLITPVC